MPLLSVVIGWNVLIDSYAANFKWYQSSIQDPTYQHLLTFRLFLFNLHAIISAVCLIHCLHSFKYCLRGHQTLQRVGDKAESWPVQMAVLAYFPAHVVSSQYCHLPMAAVQLCDDFISVHVQKCFLFRIVGFAYQL